MLSHSGNLTLPHPHPVNTMITRKRSPDKDENIGYSAIAQVIRDRCCATSVSPLLPCVCPPCTAHLTCSNRWNIALLLVTQCLVIPVFTLPFQVSYVSQQLHFKPGRDPIWALCHIISTVCTVNLASLFFFLIVMRKCWTETRLREGTDPVVYTHPNP